MGISERHAARYPDLLARLEDARARTDSLFSILRPEALYERPIGERHRFVFYLGHLEAFDWNLIGRGAFGREPLHEAFDRLFAFGIDPVNGSLPDDRASDWPALVTVEQYRQQARHAVDVCLQENARPVAGVAPLSELLLVGIEHRLMHAETLAYLMHQLPFGQKLLRPTRLSLARVAPTSRDIEIPAGIATLGQSRADRGFGWDNEFETTRVEVPAFRMQSLAVTNADYLEFVEAGGYRERSLWSAAGWEWLQRRGIVQPAFWLRRGTIWSWRGMFEALPLPLHGPVYVSHAEASAYARFRGAALPTEAQFHRAAYGTPAGGERAYPWGDAPPAAALGNFDFTHWDPVPVGSYPSSTSAFGVADLVGNGWEWTSTPFAPLPGFAPMPYYPTYSANFFDDHHYVLKGGSPRTAACLLRRSFRNWFQPHYPYVYAKFRCVREA